MDAWWPETRRGSFACVCHFLFSLSIGLLAGVDESWSQVPPVNSVVYIECRDPEGRVLSRGSGVVIDDRGGILTAKHVAPPSASCFGARGSAATAPTRRLIHRQVSKLDAMLLDFEPEPGETFEPVEYTPIIESMAGTRLSAYGFVGNTGQVVVRVGILSTTLPDKAGMVQTDILTSAGMSGGPVFEADTGALVGIVAGADFDNIGQPKFYAVLSAKEIAKELQVPEQATVLKSVDLLNAIWSIQVERGVDGRPEELRLTVLQKPQIASIKIEYDFLGRQRIGDDYLLRLHYPSGNYGRIIVVESEMGAFLDSMIIWEGRRLVEPYIREEGGSIAAVRLRIFEAHSVDGRDFRLDTILEFPWLKPQQ
ncbi:serine protease [Mesorhizobium sp.]|uniref:S1 family peptidase n=1 Tax=Mesorhizobium sp. TaxID=1871066 RepID=UPI0026833179